MAASGLDDVWFNRLEIGAMRVGKLKAETFDNHHNVLGRLEIGAKGDLALSGQRMAE